MRCRRRRDRHSGLTKRKGFRLDRFEFKLTTFLPIRIARRFIVGQRRGSSCPISCCADWSIHRSTQRESTSEKILSQGVWTPGLLVRRVAFLPSVESKRVATRPSRLPPARSSIDACGPQPPVYNSFQFAENGRQAARFRRLMTSEQDCEREPYGRRSLACE